MTVYYQRNDINFNQLQDPDFINYYVNQFRKSFDDLLPKLPTDKMIKISWKIEGVDE